MKFMTKKIAFVFFIIIFVSNPSLSKTPEEIQIEQLQEIADRLEGSTSMPTEGIMRSVQDAVESATRSAGVKSAPIAPAKTPEEEIKRRREIINSGHEQYIASASAYSLGVESTMAESATSSGSRKLDRTLDEMERDAETEGGIASERDRKKPVNTDIRDAIGESERRREATADDGSVRSDSSSSDIESSSGKRKNVQQFPPKAIGIKGKLIINGGDAVMSNNKKIEEVDYKIEEAIVGNIMFSETKDTKTRKVTETEYIIDTISKNIEVKSLSGAKCLSVENASASNITCNKSTPYVKSSIDSQNRYPNFNSNVLFLEDDGDKVKIKVDVPMVKFSTLLNEGVASARCGNAEFEMSKKEFEKMVNKGKIILKKNLEKSPGCKEGSSVEISLAVTDRK